MRKTLRAWQWRFFTSKRRRRILGGLDEIHEYYTHRW